MPPSAIRILCLLIVTFYWRGLITCFANLSGVHTFAHTINLWLLYAISCHLLIHFTCCIKRIKFSFFFFFTFLKNSSLSFLQWNFVFFFSSGKLCGRQCQCVGICIFILVFAFLAFDTRDTVDVAMQFQFVKIKVHGKAYNFNN